MCKCPECGKEFLDGRLERKIKICPVCYIKKNGLLSFVKNNFRQTLDDLGTIIRNISEIRRIRREIRAVKRDIKE